MKSPWVMLLVMAGCSGTADQHADALQARGPADDPAAVAAPKPRQPDSGPAVCNTCKDHERFWTCDDGGLELRWCYQHPESALCTGVGECRPAP